MRVRWGSWVRACLRQLEGSVFDPKFLRFTHGIESYNLRQERGLVSVSDTVRALGSGLVLGFRLRRRDRLRDRRGWRGMTGGREGGRRVYG